MELSQQRHRRSGHRSNRGPGKLTHYWLPPIAVRLIHFTGRTLPQNVPGGFTIAPEREIQRSKVNIRGDTCR